MTKVMTPALAAVVIAAKGLTVLLRLLDGGGQDLATAWAPAVLLYQDVWLVLSFAAVELATIAATAGRSASSRWSAAARRGPTVLFGVLVAWTAVNVPIARVFSTPATFAMLDATGAAIGDSIRVYLTPLNLAAPVALAALAIALTRPSSPARAVPAPRRIGVMVLLVVVGVVGFATAPRVSTLGLHRNAVVTILSTTFMHRTAGGPAGSSHVHAGAGPTAARACLPESDAATGAATDPARDLGHLSGAARRRNVVWVVLESTGARVLSPYRARRDVTPHLSVLARDAVVFDTAYAAYPESIKGLYSMLCARVPLVRRRAEAHAQGRIPCDPLPARLATAGYHTGLFHSGRFAYLGMEEMIRDRGFGVMDDGATIGGAYRSSFGVDEASTVQRLLRFVDQVPAGAPFFAMYLPIAGHHPYHAPGAGPRPFTEGTPADAHANDLFAGDAAFGTLRQGLQARGLDENTLYVIVGDHGEAFFEHEGNFGHTLFVYEENVRVPFIIAAPGLLRGVRRAPQLASLIDVAPTILDLLDLPPLARHDGHSLLDGQPRLVRFFTDQGLWQAALRDGRWKLIEERDSGRVRLFDLLLDPGEKRDLAAGHAERVRRYSACLAASG